MKLEELKEIHNWNMPLDCPVCGERLKLSGNHKQLSCTNVYCPAKTSGVIAKWCEKMKIQELGLTTIEKIQDLGYFKSVSSLYSDIQDCEAGKLLTSLLGKNYENIKNEINSHRECTLAQFIAGYNIAGVGEKLIQKIIEFRKLEKLDDFLIGKENLICEGVGFIIAEKLYEGVKVNYSDMIKTLKHIRIVQQGNKLNTKLNGKSFCFTGAMEYKRSVLQEYVEKNGGVNYDSVKKGLDFLVMQDPSSTSSKAVKARALNIMIISPGEFMRMFNENN